MKIKYSKTRLFSNLLLGSLFSIWGGLKIMDGTADYFNSFQLVLGLLMVGNYFFERKYQYLRIEYGVLTKNSFRRKTVTLKEIVKIESFPGKIRLLTSEEKLIINLQVIEEDSCKDLYPVLGSLDLGSNDNPFIGYSRNPV